MSPSIGGMVHVSSEMVRCGYMYRMTPASGGPSPSTSGESNEGPSERDILSTP